MIIGKTYLSSTSVWVLLAVLIIVGSLSATKIEAEDDSQSVSPTALSMRSVSPGDRELFSGEALSDCCFNFFVLLLSPVIGKGPADIKEECKNKLK